MPYSGAPWRSRFLRGPKIGFDLAERPDFVPLSDLARVRLGMKSGCDAFFFLTVAGKAVTPSRIRLKGLNGWQGDVLRSDLLPGIQSPKELDGPTGRLASIPQRNGRYSGGTYYLFPRALRLDAVLREYKELAERQDIHRRNLVQSNGDDNAWYRQTRNRVTSPWALPYNSGYDYGAVDNAVGAVLNGRLVGVDPLEGVSSDLLGAVLNSTPVALMRLLEGVATGNEGAFDVGPPAARVMRVPDPRRITGTAAEDVRRAMAAVKASSVQPPAPEADGSVSDLRRRLDLAVLTGLGMTRGEATVLSEAIYRSYGRWRKAVEGVEDQMQVHRRALARRGGSRGESPILRAARTVWEEMSPETPMMFADFLVEECEHINPLLPRDAEAGEASPLFEVTAVRVAGGGSLDLGHAVRLEMARYLRSVGFTGTLPIPKSPIFCEKAIAEIKLAGLAFDDEAEQRARGHVSGDYLKQVASQAHALWIGASIAGIRASMAEQDVATPNPSIFQPEGLVPRA